MSAQSIKRRAKAAFVLALDRGKNVLGDSAEHIEGVVMVPGYGFNRTCGDAFILIAAEWKHLAPFWRKARLKGGGMLKFVVKPHRSVI